MSTILNDVFDCVFYINLDHRKDRRVQAEETFRKFGIRAQRFDACKAENPLDLRSREKACAMSHFSVLRLAALYGCKRVLVLEDDVDFVPDFNEEMEGIAPVLDVVDWDMFHLGAPDSAPGRAEVIKVPKTPWRTHAYAVNAKAFRTVILAVRGIMAQISYGLHRTEKSEGRGIDWIYVNMELLMPVTLNCYATTRQLALQREGFSDVEWQLKPTY